MTSTAGSTNRLKMGSSYRRYQHLRPAVPRSRSANIGSIRSDGVGGARSLSSAVRCS